MVELGQRLKELRLSHGLTQKQVAERVGLQNTIISFYEVGDRNPSLDMLVKLAALFNVSTDYLLGVEKSESIDVSGLTKENKKLVYELVEQLKNSK